MNQLSQWYRNLPINRKISQAIFWTNIFVLLLLSGSIVVYELTVTRRRAQENVDAMTQIIAANAAGTLAFGDPSSAEQILFILNDQPQIISARLYDLKGMPFATYLRPGT